MRSTNTTDASKRQPPPSTPRGSFPTPMRRARIALLRQYRRLDRAQGRNLYRLGRATSNAMRRTRRNQSNGDPLSPSGAESLRFRLRQRANLPQFGDVDLDRRPQRHGPRTDGPGVPALPASAGTRTTRSRRTMPVRQTLPDDKRATTIRRWRHDRLVQRQASGADACITASRPCMNGWRRVRSTGPRRTSATRPANSEVLRRCRTRSASGQRSTTRPGGSNAFMSLATCRGWRRIRVKYRPVGVVCSVPFVAPVGVASRSDGTRRDDVTARRVAAPRIITTPPVMTATSRIAVWICTGMRSTKALARNAPGSAMHADQQRKGQHLRGDDAGEAEHRNLDDAGRRPRSRRRWRSRPRLRGPTAINSDSRITPEPEVPPTTHAVADRAGRKPGVADPHIAALGQPAQRHAQDQHGADHQRRAGAGEPRIAVGAERGGQRRRAAITISARRRSA